MTVRPADLVGWRRGDDPHLLLRKEWLVTNGLGGYASGTASGVSTRRYHGLLIAALPAPFGRYMMLNHLGERVVSGDSTFHLSGEEPEGGDVRMPEISLLEEFKLEFGLPLWRFAGSRIGITKRLLMPHLQNTTLVIYELDASSEPVTLLLTPSIHFRPHENDVTSEFETPYAVRASGPQLEIAEGDVLPSLKVELRGGEVSMSGENRIVDTLLYRLEKSRGYKHAGALWSPGTMSVTIAPGQSVTLACSTEAWDTVSALAAGEALEAERKRREQLLSRAALSDDDPPVLANLVLAADQFIIVPETRARDAALAHAAGEEPRTIIAGYHWFTDWGRDTMISLEGLTLSTGRQREAASILRTFAGHVRDGLIPNMFPEGENEGVYHTADATMWFFQAVHRYVEATGDRETLRRLLPVLQEIIDQHIRGTRFGIGVDACDGLLRQGAEGYQLTWMDAKVEDWVVTPRRGKAVEINALFYNAVTLLAEWSRDEGDHDRAEELFGHAERARKGFNDRFWYAEGEYLFDVVDMEGGGNDTALRPNQIFSISLPRPILDPSRWSRVVAVVRDELLTPVGLRSLARSHPDYKATYAGDLRTRDAAYHQGTVWSWLIGPFIDAWLKTHPDDDTESMNMLEGLLEHLSDAGVGSVSEIFDAEDPYQARGCIAQAWGVAELLRCLRRVARSRGGR